VVPGEEQSTVWLPRDKINPVENRSIVCELKLPKMGPEGFCPYGLPSVGKGGFVICLFSVMEKKEA